MKTISQLYKEALDVQDACNLNAVVLGFSRVLSDLRENLGPGASTGSINQHPVAILWADKVAHLTGTQTLGSEVVNQAYRIAYKTVRGEED